MFSAFRHESSNSNDCQNDGRIHPLLQDQRDRRGEDENGAGRLPHLLEVRAAIVTDQPNG
jgi:hypothetical protein